MAIFRVEKTRDYTVMSNHHLKNKALTLKAKGLLSQMLSLPESWDYSLKGLSHINRESIDAIRTAVWELEKAGYIIRQQGRDQRGKMTAIVYIIYEQPQLDIPLLENPTPDKSISDSPIPENPASEKPTQINTNRSNTDSINNKAAANPNLSNLYPSIPQRENADTQIEIGWEKGGFAAAVSFRETIENQVEYSVLAEDAHIPQGRLDEIVDLMTEVMCATNPTMTIAGNEYPTTLVQERFRHIGSRHIQYVFECLNKNTSRVRNIKKYLMAVLFNAPSTMDGYYAAKINHDFGVVDLDDFDF